MTRKHFEALAKEIKAIGPMGARQFAARAVCKAARRFNDLFDTKRFMLACGLGEGE